MIVIKSGTISQEAESTTPYLEVTGGGGSYTVTRHNDGQGPSITVSVSDIAPWDRKLYYWSYYGDGFVSPVNYEDSRDEQAFMQSRFGVRDVSFVAARGGNDELVIVTRSPTKTSLTYSQYSQHGPVIEAIDSAIPGYKTSQRARANKAKRDLLAMVNPMDMLAEQEKQLDLVSMLVVDLAERLPEADRPIWLASFKSMLQQQNSTQYKGSAGCISDILERKTFIRGLQSAYFAERDA